MAVARLRVAVVDDHPFIVKVLSDALATTDDLELAGAFESGTAALAALPGLDADVVVVDQNLRDTISGLDLIARLKADGSPARCLLFTAERDEVLAAKARAAGAAGALSKLTKVAELVEAIRRVGRGEPV